MSLPSGTKIAPCEIVVLSWPGELGRLVPKELVMLPAVDTHLDDETARLRRYNLDAPTGSIQPGGPQRPKGNTP